MSLKKGKHNRKSEKMPNMAFHLMTLTFNIIDFVFSYIDRRIKKFGIEKGMTIVDYGCGPGRYTTRFSKLVGEKGKVYAIDIHELAIKFLQKKIEKYRLNNIVPILASGYDSTIPDNTADIVCAIDMFFIIKKSVEFLKELKRITKNDGTLIIDDGHQPRRKTKSSIIDSSLWEIYEETPDHLKCRPL